MALVASQVVENDNIAGLERGHEDLCDIDEELLAIDQSVEHARRGQPLITKSGQKGLRSLVSMRRLADQALATRYLTMVIGIPARSVSDRLVSSMTDVLLGQSQEAGSAHFLQPELYLPESV